MKKMNLEAFEAYMDTSKLAEKIADADALNEALGVFFSEFDSHCRLEKREKKRLLQDFQRAIIYYLAEDLPLQEALSRLDVKYLGGFYARPSAAWFPLDDAAKIYPISMDQGRMVVFRLSVNLKQAVVPELLQMALNFTIKRFPSFATTLKKGVFWHYLDTAKRRFDVQQENDIPCQPLRVSASGSQSFRVLYFENRISVEFFHVLTDGTGGMTFLKVLTAEYLRLLGVKLSSDEDVWDVNGLVHPQEYENAFAKVPRVKNASGFVDKPAVQMNGKLSRNRPCRILHFKMPIGELKAAAKAKNASVTAYLTALMFQALKAGTDELAGEVSIQIPVNMRKFYPSKTVRNFSMYCGVRIPLEHIGPADAMLPEIQNQLEQKASQKAMSQMLTATVRLVRALRFVPLLIKQPVAKVIYGFLGDQIFTTTFSNLGVVTMPPEAYAHIESMDFALGTAISNRVSCSMVTFGDVANFTVTKLTVDPSFEEKMLDLLKNDGVSVCVEGSALYES